MTQVRMKRPVAGTFHGIENPRPGDVVEVGGEAERYIRLDLAEPVGEERAVPDQEDVETAVPVKRGPGRPKKVPPGMTTTLPAGTK